MKFSIYRINHYIINCIIEDNINIELIYIDTNNEIQKCQYILYNNNFNELTNKLYHLGLCHRDTYKLIELLSSNKDKLTHDQEVWFHGFRNLIDMPNKSYELGDYESVVNYNSWIDHKIERIQRNWLYNHDFSVIHKIHNELELHKITNDQYSNMCKQYNTDLTRHLPTILLNHLVQYLHSIVISYLLIIDC
jgi:hypothetical protein